MFRFLIFALFFCVSAVAEQQIFDDIKSGRINDIRKAYNDSQKSIKAIGEYGQSTLMHAVVNDKYEIAEFLVRNGVDTNIQDYGGATALHIAARKGSVVMTELLLKNGANPKLTDFAKYKPVSRAIDFNRGDVVAILSKGY